MAAADTPSILIVDDNPNNLRVLEGILATAGYGVRPALNGEIALRAARAAPPDLVLLDIRMPDLDGYSVCRQLKDHPATAEVPVIFISALQEMEDKILAFRAGGVDYIVKPFQSEEVLARVRTHVELARTRRLLARSNESLEQQVAARTEALRASNVRLGVSMRQEQALRQVLALSLAEPDLKTYLERSLRRLSEIVGWQEPEHKSALFLSREQGRDRRMDMVAAVGLPLEQLTYCAVVGYDDCLCGDAACRQRELNIDATHCPADLRYPDLAPRGRSAIPLVSEGVTLGVLMHAVAGEASVPPDDEIFLRQVASVLTMGIARRYADERIAFLAYHDELTGLYNRSSLHDRLVAELRRIDPPTGPFAVLFVDLDNFKQINDVFGHGAGDDYLKVTADRLSAARRAGDALCRWGSDEFVVLASDLGGDAAEAAAQAHAIALAIAGAVARPVPMQGHDVQLNASVGIALYPGDGHSAQELLQHAELALSRAKQGGRNLIRFYHPDMQAAAVRRMTLSRELRQGVEQRQFVLHYQPQVDWQGRLQGAEGLIRWQHPERGLVPPMEFIPLAEELGLIVELGEWVLVEATRWLRSLSEHAGFSSLPLLAVNVSARQFYESGFVERCLAIVGEAGVAPQAVELEVTESLLLADIEGAKQKIAALHEAGFRFAVDDFGTGYSSLAYLKNLPVQKLKIDRSFVQDVHSDERNAAIVRTIVALANNLGMSTIAEGVERQEEADFLKEAGCGLFQGFRFGRPLAADEFVRAWQCPA